MLRRLIEKITGPVSDDLFKEALIETERDIRVNRMTYNLNTSLTELIAISSRYIRMEKRTAYINR